MKMSPFSAPFSWGTQKRRLLLPKQAAALWEGTQWCKGGTGKAEDAKLPDAGISPKQCPESERLKKAGSLDSGRIARGFGAWEPSQSRARAEVACSLKGRSERTLGPNEC